MDSKVQLGSKYGEGSDFFFIANFKSQPKLQDAIVKNNIEDQLIYS
jgi:hypothetical protein